MSAADISRRCAVRDAEIKWRRLTANVSQDQRDWLETYTFREWPEYMLKKDVIVVDHPPSEQEWRRLIATINEH